MTIHSLNDIIGFGLVDLRLQIGTGLATGVAKTFMETVGKVVATSMVEVTVKEPKQISTGLARISAMLAGKTTPDHATMLHSEFPNTPTWRANYQGARPRRSARGRHKRLWVD
jgi:hypothetical protein